ncbi:MAG: hypothetical protein R2774_10595 [Saprospiraceae bacterium]
MNDFDDLIKSKLDKIDKLQNKDTWSLLESKLDHIDHPIQNAEKYDAEVNKKLSTIPKSFNDAHWTTLKWRLNLIKQRKDTIYSAKTIESIMFLFTLILFIKFPGFFFPIKDTHSLPIEIAQLKSDIDPAELYRAPQINESRNFKQSIRNQNTTKIKSLKTKPSDIELPFLISQKSTPLHSINPNESGSVNIGYLNSHLLIPLASKIGINEDSVAAKTQINTLVVAESLPSIEHKPQSEYALIVPMQFTTPHQNTKHGLGVWVSKDVNMINTPFDKVYSLASYNKEALSNAVSIFYEQRRGRLALDFGAMYAAKSYSPQQLKETYGAFDGYYFEKSLDRIHYKIGSMYTNMKYDALSYKNLNVFLSGGVQCNVILAAEYNISDDLVHGSVTGRFAQPEDKLSEKTFTRGILHNASFDESYFVSAGFGLGASYNITKNTSLFLQGGYQRQLFSKDLGIGPNKDKIHTSSLQFGAVTYIN